MTDWIPVRDSLPETDEWVLAQTQDGTVYPAIYRNNAWYQWSSLKSSSLIEQLMHGKVAYWLPKTNGYPYVQCQCGQFYLQAEGRKTCPICASFGIEPEKPKKPRKPKEEPVEEIPFDEPPTESLDDMLI